MTDRDLHERLGALGAQIDSTLERIRQESELLKGDGHLLTGRALKERYGLLKARIEAEVADAEAHGHHVGELEKSVRRWMVGLDHSL